MKVAGGKRSAPTGPRRTHVPRPGGAQEFETITRSCAPPGRGFSTPWDRWVRRWRSFPPATFIGPFGALYQAYAAAS